MNNSRLLFLSALLCCLGPLASAQGSDGFFPYHVGDRWIYHIEGVTPYSGVPYSELVDTVDAFIEWEILDIRTSEKADSLSIAVGRQNRDGSMWAETCGLIYEPEPLPYLRLVEGAVPELCTVRGGLPFHIYHSYPYLHGRDTLGTATVGVGGSMYVVEAASAYYGHDDSCCGRVPHAHTYRTDVEALLADGIGMVEMTYRFHHNYRWSDPIRRDTLRSRLVGAEIDGQVYGNIQPVASESDPRPSSLVIRVGPNPTRGEAVVWVSGTEVGTRVRVRVLDVRGRVVRDVSAVPRNGAPLQTGGLAPGVYHVVARSANNFAHARLVITR